jgi:hypothetical protein
LQVKHIIEEALEASCQEFCRLVDEAIKLLRSENGRIGNIEVVGRLIKLQPFGEALIVGDLHGDLESLINILKGSNLIQRISQNDNAFAIFLGDYGDRGPVETMKAQKTCLSHLTICHGSLKHVLAITGRKRTR